MELIEEYLEKIVKVHGVYVLRVDEDCTDEMKHQIFKSWEMTGSKHMLMIMPSSFDLSFNERYSFYVALMMIRAGRKVTRDQWVEDAVPQPPMLHTTPRSRMKAMYLSLDEDGDVMKTSPCKGYHAIFEIKKEDLDAEDYVLVPE